MAGIFTEESIQRVRDANDIVNIVERYVPLKRTGARFKALCPFHNEKTPSFTVNPEMQLYKCFGCGEGGDIFKFLMKVDGLSFPEAVESLASHAGLTLERTNGSNPNDYSAVAENKSKLYRITSLALIYFEESLKSSAGRQAREYLRQRGFNERTSDTWRLGWANDSFEKLSDFLRQRCTGKAEQAIAAAITTGLLKEGNIDSPYDFFRGRVMFPILDAQHRPIAFGGRILHEDGQKKVGKYINSPESQLFHKSRVLFGLNAASKEIRLSGTAIIVEGYTDVVMCHQYGINNVVATLGTALTREHVRILRRYANSVIAHFDGDEAGARASERAMRIFVEEDVPLKILRSESTKDACEYLPKFGADKFKAELKKAEDTFSFHFRKCFSNAQLRNVDEKTRAVRQSMELVNLSPDRIKREMLRRTVAETAGISIESLPERAKNSLLHKKRESTAPWKQGIINPQSSEVAEKTKPDTPAKINATIIREHCLLTYMLKQQSWCDAVCCVKPPEEFGTELLRELATEIHDSWAEDSKTDTTVILQRLQSPDASQLLSDLVMTDAPELSEEKLAESLHFERLQVMEQEKSMLRRELQRAKAIADSAKINQLASSLHHLSKEIDELKQCEIPDTINSSTV